MQTNCPQCSQRLVVEDDKVPAGPFMLRCPRCQAGLKLPGKSGTAVPPSAQTEAGSPAEKPAPPRPKSLGPASTPPVPSAVPPPGAVPSGGRSEASTHIGNALALVALTNGADDALQQAVVNLLERTGYSVDTVTEPQQGVLALERHSYSIVATTPNGSSTQGNVSPYKRIAALAPEIRRSLFLVLLGSNFSSGDGTQAFAAMADLVLNPKDVASSDELLRSTVNERNRLYQAFQDAQARLDRRKY